MTMMKVKKEKLSLVAVAIVCVSLFMCLENAVKLKAAAAGSRKER